VDLRAKLLGAEEHEPQVAAAFGDVEQHLADVGVRSVAGRVLVQLVHEDDHVAHAEIAPLEVLTQP
jgi:hypothetical protein